MLLFTGMRRRRLRSRPFPPDWLLALERQIPFYPLLPPADREELRGHIQVFLAEKNVEGGGGFRVTDEVRLIIAAHACLLLLHRDTGYFPGLSSIVVYPGEFVAPLAEVDEAGIVTEGEDLRSGESWQQGTLVLSWEDVLLGGTEGYEDYNVIFHEFAHQLDARPRRAGVKVSGTRSSHRNTGGSGEERTGGGRPCSTTTGRKARRSSSPWLQRRSSPFPRNSGTNCRACMPDSPAISARTRQAGPQRRVDASPLRCRAAVVPVEPVILT